MTDPVANDSQPMLLEALKKSEARYRRIIEATNEGVWQLDTQGRTVYVNQRMAEMLGYSVDEFMALSVYDVCAEEDRTRARTLIGDRLRGISEQHDWRFTRKDGSTIWCIVSGVPLKEDDDTIVGVLGMMLDITARKTAEDRARSLSRLYAVSSSVNEAIVRVREPQQLYELACRIAVEQGEFPMAWIAMRDAVDQPLRVQASCGGTESFIADVMRRVNSAAASPGPAGRALRDGAMAVSNDIGNDPTFFFKDTALTLGMRACAVFPMKIGARTLGIMSIYSAHVGYFSDEELRVLVALADDISFAVESAEQEAARKRALDELQESQRVHATLLRNLPGMVYRCRNDSEWSIHFVSDGCLTLTGYTPEQLYAGGTTSYEQIIHPDDRHLVRSAIEAALTAREPFELFYRIVAANGQQKWVWERGSGVFDEQNELRFIEGYVTDITQRKLLEARVLNAQRMESIGTFAGGIAHDFNNILTAIAGNARLALSDLNSTHPVHGHVREIEKSAARAGELVRQILTFSRQQRASREVVSLPALLDELLNTLPFALPATIKLHKELDASVPPVAVDAAQLKQAVINLISNAIQAMLPDGGTLSIALSAATLDETDSGQKTPADLPPGSYVCITVSDTGVGMDAALQARIFEPFFTTKPSGHGTGLGLSVVYGVVRGHAGGIAVHSELGRGSSFAVYLPAAERAAVSAAPAPTPGPAESGAGQRVLYVDDEEALVFLTTRVLERLGYHVTGCIDAVQALQDFRADPFSFDAVVSDLSMPGMSGIEFARELKAIRADLPIVMTSGYIRDEDLNLVRELGIRDLVLKPNTVEELGAVLHRVLTAK
jgi:PAS domain S-box-containing protein